MTSEATPAAVPAWRGWAAGTRVVVRRRLSADEAAASGRKVTDVIGVVLDSGDWGLRLRPDGAREDPATAEPVTVEAAGIVTGKQIPPRRARR